MSLLVVGLVRIRSDGILGHNWQVLTIHYEIYTSSIQRTCRNNIKRKRKAQDKTGSGRETGHFPVEPGATFRTETRRVACHCHAEVA
jgi:hypothetical protein